MLRCKTDRHALRRASRVAFATGLASVLATAGSAGAARPTAGSVTSERLKVPSGPSSVRGLADEPEVALFYAQVNYQVPIELPAGLGGLTPSLALTYSGALGNGPLGIGWSFSQARIQRSTRLGVPTFDDRDTLELSGLAGIAPGRLIAISGTEYRVEGLGQTVRVKRVGSGFEVDDGSGVHYRLGATANTRQESDLTHTVAWLVEEVSNQMGERIRYQYLHDLGQIYLSQVIWGPGEAYRADLIYEARGDATRSFRDGFAVTTARRVAALKVMAFGTERRAYQLAYDPTFTVSRLAGVTSTGVAGAGAWPALTFRYATPAAPTVTPVAGVGAWRLNAGGTTLVDLNGDGAAELLQLAAGAHSYLSNRNGTFSGLQPLSGNSQAISALQLQDVDGDARAELLQDTGNGWAVWKFSRTQWVSQAASLPGGVWPGSAGLALKQPTLARFADLNGDGLVDALQWNNDGLQVRLATRTGLPTVATSVGKIGGGVLPTDAGRFHDANGDGLDDYVVVGTSQLELYLGHGDGRFDPVTPIAYPVSGVWNPDNVELADLDRDGLMDLVRVDQGTVRWFRGQASGAFSATAVTLNNPEPLSSSVVVAVADSNGNGSQDVVWSSAGGMWRMDLAGTTTAGMLLRVQNGLGLDVTFDYQSSHALSTAARVAGAPWAIELPISMPVPVQKTTSLGAGEVTRRVTYTVRDGFWDAVEQQFGGFLSTIVTTAGATAAETSSVSTRYVNGVGVDRVLRGRPQTVQIKDGTGRRLSIAINTWETMGVAGLPDLPLLRRAVLRGTQTFYEDVAPNRESDVTYEYDTLGRRTRAVDQGRLDVTGDESVTEQRYADDDLAWIRDVGCEEKVLSLTGVIASHVQHLFGDDTVIAPLCVVGKGWPRETRSYLASEARFVTTSQQRYDAHGNPISQTYNGVTRALAYDPTGLFPIEERLTAAPGRELTWRATWDVVLGAAAAVTDPNGHVTHVSYDSLGRFAGVAIDTRPLHQVVEYDWTAPYPKTIVWDYDGDPAQLGAKPSTWTPTAHWRQSVEVANGKGEVRYRAQRLAATQWILSGYQERDPNSRVVFAGRPVYVSQLELASRPAGMVGDQLRYDPLGRLIEQQLATGARRTFSYLSFERTMQDADLAPVHSVLDGRGRAILTERSLADGTHEIVEARYDAADRLTTMRLASGAVQRDFGYDTLGRLVQSHDPDLGTRTLTWDDGGRLLSETNAAGQTLAYSYDGLGRLLTRTAGVTYRYHYDDARPGSTGGTNLAGRLAWVEEPIGVVELGYDELGRVGLSRRRIDDRTSEATTRYAPSGLVLSRGYDDGFTLAYKYDPASRPIGAGDLWTLLDQDAAGQPLHELAQNGVDTVYQRDGLGLASKVTVRDGFGTVIYDVQATRNTWTGITAIADLDGVGLDHNALFGYDGFARLTSATVGAAGASAFSFGYGYDVLHNMTSRTATGPQALHVLTGTYRYGEGGHGPRQLTSIASAAGVVTHTFDYDAAGRQTVEDDLVMTYDASDRLLQVDGLPGGSVAHVYGQDGARVRTVSPDGSVAYFFGDGTVERGGVREHDVAVGDRVIARVRMVNPTQPDGSGPAGAGAGLLGAAGRLGLGGVALAVLGLGLVSLGRRPRRVRLATAAALLGLLLSGGVLLGRGGRGGRGGRDIGAARWQVASAEPRGSR